MPIDAFRRFAKDRHGNVVLFFGLTAIPLVLAVGMAIDYGNNARKWSRMNAAADAAALAAVTPSMMMASDDNARTAAQKLFAGNIAEITDIIPTSVKLDVSISNAGLTRTATVSYSARVKNIFGGILGLEAMSVSGRARANGSTPPNVDFYLLLDTSPSMAIPAAQAGISTMIANTPKQTDGSTKGCAFACHQYNPSPDNLGNPGGVDNYALARNLGLRLRIDEVGSAASAMVNSAIPTMSQNASNYGWTPTYRIAVNTFDVSFNSLYSLTSNLSALRSTLSANPSPIQVYQVYSNNNICTSIKNGACKSFSANNDTDTNIDAALAALNTSSSANYIPNPGTGAKGSNPAEVLMIVTDGVEDQLVGSITAGLSLSIPGGYRQQAPIAANSKVPSAIACAAIKARGIKIAVLYTTYYPLDNGNAGSWYDKYIYPFQPGGISGDQIGTALKNNCASPGLFYQVNVGEDISAALVNLFQLTLQSSRLTQ
ncbi:MAG TPA: pilus assembly protein TadG-related protein [Roseiarcus sp.]|nr:pilus assembly protein TadG-related protein [Roseiarcus sp.]